MNNIVYISDTHCGCRVALCPPKGIRLDGGGWYHPSELQQKMYAMWEHFWDVFVPEVTHGEPYVVVMNGDAVDGSHHKSKTQISQNFADQHNIAMELLAPIVERAETYYHIRGTEAHVGQSAENEEILARSLGAKPNAQGEYSRFDLWKTIGPSGDLVHFLHHVGSTGSQAYEATAVHKELTESYIEAARWGRRPPTAIVRSHRHRSIEINIPTQLDPNEPNETQQAMAVVSACWQGKTPFVWKIPGGRLSTPQFGGGVLRYHEKDRVLFNRAKVWTVERSEVE